VRGACWKLRDRLGRRTSLLNYTVPHPNPTHKWVRTHSAPFWCWDKPRANLDSFDSPRLGLRGSHHLPPYIILYSSLRDLHPNGFFSRDSESGIPKLSRFGLLGLWTLIAPRPKLGSGRGLNQSCSSPRELSNGVSHFTCTHWNWVDSWLLVVGSQTASSTPDLSFDHNLCYKCPNGSCDAFWTSTLQDLSNDIKMPQCEMFWPLKSRSKFLRVPKDSQVPFSGVWVATSQLPQSGVATTPKTIKGITLTPPITLTQYYT